MATAETQKLLTQTEIAELLDTAMTELISNTSMRRLGTFCTNSHCPNILESYIDMTGIVPISIVDVNKDPSIKSIIQLLKSNMVKQLAEMINILSQDLLTMTQGD